MSEFLKSGNRVVAKPSGLDYKLETNKLYYLKYDSWEGTTYLEINNGDLKLPETLIYSDSENNFVTKILSYFKRTNKQTTGVLLNGLKGSGKTVMAKLIARNSNLPIIIVSSDCPTRHVSTFFSKFKDTETCVIFDEIDKNERYWNTEDLLSFLDGIRDTGKKLVLLTCNTDSKINEYILDRCSRVRYYRKFESLTKESIIEVAEKYIPKDKIEEVTDFIINRFKCISYDNVVSFLEEVKEYNSETLENIAKDLNITTICNPKR